jgi:hypothetical protein
MVSFAARWGTYRVGGSVVRTADNEAAVAERRGLDDRLSSAERHRLRIAPVLSAGM